jgi:hypothetical protein
MTAFLPISEEQRARWARPRPEPVTLALPEWQVHSEGDAEPHPNMRWTWLRRGAQEVELMRHWDRPRNPGLPMAVASRREVTVAGRPAELLRTSVFDGVPQAVDLLWLTGRGHGVDYGVRLKFTGCDATTIDEVLARLEIAW